MASTVRCLKPSISTSPFFSSSSATHPLLIKIHPNSRIHSLQNPPPPPSRRLFLPSVSSIWYPLTGGSNNNNAREVLPPFEMGDILGSLVEFDKAIELDPRQKAYLWQRGLSLYYLDRFEEGAEQFRIDVARNPNDTEKLIWCFLCEAQLYGVDEARQLFLEIGRDPQPVIREAYNMFKDGGDP